MLRTVSGRATRICRTWFYNPDGTLQHPPKPRNRCIIINGSKYYPVGSDKLPPPKESGSSSTDRNGDPK